MSAGRTLTGNTWRRWRTPTSPARHVIGWVPLLAHTPHLSQLSSAESRGTATSLATAVLQGFGLLFYGDSITETWAGTDCGWVAGGHVLLPASPALPLGLAAMQLNTCNGFVWCQLRSATACPCCAEQQLPACVPVLH